MINVAPKHPFQKRIVVSGYQETADLVTFTKEILNGKLHFLGSANHRKAGEGERPTVTPLTDFTVSESYLAIANRERSGEMNLHSLLDQG